jgi:hypothetical protein
LECCLRADHRALVSMSPFRSGELARFTCRAQTAILA